MSRQQDAQMELIRGLREDLETANKNGDDTAKKLKAEIDLKATEKALTALALETSRDKQAAQKKSEQFEKQVDTKFNKHEQRLEAQQSKLYDCKVALDTKAETRTVDALTTRVDGCATTVELADTKIALRNKIQEIEDTNTSRFEAIEVTQGLHANRIDALEDYAKTVATRAELQALDKACREADEALAKETAAVEERGAKALDDAKRMLEARHVKAEETLERHWSHIRNVEELVRTKADREMVQQGIDKAAADTAAVDAKFSAITNESISKTDEWQKNADIRLDSAEIRLDEAEATLKTKATLEETKELREKVALCSLRTEMRELLEGLRQETSSRVRILKERLDRTDRELLRQLEDTQNNDRSDKFDALVQLVETKADKALTERWLEASQQLHGELQTVHVRTQTLGQGMKVVLGWVEGMADKVTGLQAGQHRVAQQVQSAREEQQFALNATARETISKVKGMLATQGSVGAGGSGGMQPTPPGMPAAASGSFQPPKPLSRPTTSESGSRGPVVLKSHHGNMATAQDGMACASMTDAEANAGWGGGGMGMAGSFGGASALEQAGLAGPAGAALAGAVPLTGVMGKSALEHLASEPPPSINSPRGGSKPGSAIRTEAQRRQANLDAKRQELVDSRMRPGSGVMQPDISEPRPPSQPRPDPSLGTAHGVSPRRLELEGQPPP